LDAKMDFNKGEIGELYGVKFHTTKK